MDFALTEEQQMLKTNVRSFLEKEIAPVVDEHEKQGALTREATVSFIQQLMPFGYLVGFLPEQYGCPGPGPVWPERFLLPQDSGGS
jgi:glutaryl-CoA dehydrogenase (non-decarboxylating)